MKQFQVIRELTRREGAAYMRVLLFETDNESDAMAVYNRYRDLGMHKRNEMFHVRYLFRDTIKEAERIMLRSAGVYKED